MITSFFRPKQGSDTKKKRPPTNDDDADINLSIKSPKQDSATAKNKRRKTLRDVEIGNKSSIKEVHELIQYLQCDGTDKDDNPESSSSLLSWKEALSKQINSPSFINLAKFVASERSRGSPCIFPPADDIFSALTLTPLHKVKVVVVGQDPYHGFGQGHGLAFSVKIGVAIPPSLRNIYKELNNDQKVDFSNHLQAPNKSRNGLPSHGYLKRWAQQGVLMLNSVLTVRSGQANSHKGKGWERFTDEVIRIVESNAQNGKLVFLLWGKPASKKAEGIINKKNGHTIICTSHPSPLGATKTNAPFMGSRCFSRANEALVKNGLDPIDWNVDD